MKKLSLEGQISALVLGSILSAGALITGIWLLLESWVVAVSVGCVFAIVAGMLAIRAWINPVLSMLRALENAVASYGDNDFSLSIDNPRGDELGRLADAHNALGETLRRERQNLFQRELLLDTVIATSPMVLLLVDFRGRILVANLEARRMLRGGKRLEGLALSTVLDDLNDELALAIRHENTGLVRFAVESGEETYHLSLHRFDLNARPHTLIMLKHLTRELNREELDVWKRVIRIISHELNNSLAPIQSLAGSGAKLLAQGRTDRLDQVLQTIGERAQHLAGFVAGYAEVAKLPAPKLEDFDWKTLLESVNAVIPFRTVNAVDLRGYGDSAQLQQVLLNLVKNARESGGAEEEVTLEVRRDRGGSRVTVADRGPGMSASVLQQALLPFYSTKPGGSGVGLALAREVIDAHDGWIKLDNRNGGGLAVSFWIPTRCRS